VAQAWTTSKITKSSFFEMPYLENLSISHSAKTSSKILKKTKKNEWDTYSLKQKLFCMEQSLREVP